MTPSPEQLEHIRISQRASLRNAQTFNLFTMLVAGGKRPDEALRDAEAAIELWGEYEDAHMIEPPPAPSMSEILSKFGEMADRLGKPALPVPAQIVWLNAERCLEYATQLDIAARNIREAAAQWQARSRAVRRTEVHPNEES